MSTVQIVNLSIQRALTYRARFFIQTFAGLLQLVLLWFLWSAVYGSRDELNGFNINELRTYLFLAYALNLLLPVTIDYSIAHSVRDGSIAMELLKPIDYLKLRLSEATGFAIANNFVLGFATTALAAILFQITLPNVWNLLLFMVSVIGSFLLRFCITLITGLLCFWTTSPHGVVTARISIASFLSGGLVPIAFFPDWLERSTYLLPFQATVHTPAMIFLGRATTRDALPAIGVQVLWIVGLWFIARLMLRRGLRIIDSYGG